MMVYQEKPPHPCQPVDFGGEIAALFADGAILSDDVAMFGVHGVEDGLLDL